MLFVVSLRVMRCLFAVRCVLFVVCGSLCVVLLYVYLVGCLLFVCCGLLWFVSCCLLLNLIVRC